MFLRFISFSWVLCAALLASNPSYAADVGDTGRDVSADIAPDVVNDVIPDMIQDGSGDANGDVANDADARLDADDDVTDDVIANPKNDVGIGTDTQESDANAEDTGSENKPTYNGLKPEDPGFAPDVLESSDCTCSSLNSKSSASELIVLLLAILAFRRRTR